MLFNTPIYFLFLAFVVALYWRLALRKQNVLLLACSYFFYGWWDWRFLFLMGTSTVVDYWLALRIDSTGNHARRRAYLILSLVMNFGFLGVFKYFNFFLDSFSHVAALFGATGRFGPYLNLLLPAGISFYTFQAVAYIVDVYFRKMRPARSLVDYGLFISLFPHLVAGPIQRPSHLLPQVQRERHFEPRAFFDGLALIVTGLFRKCVIADNCSLLANAAFGGQLGKPSLAVLLLGAYAFAWQIYGDFSGYSDIARGSAQLLGFHFMVNFRQPYLATGLSEFWRRWHISLSTWLRDYLYIPMGGNRVGTARTYRNLFATMLLGGLWHGAQWTFVFWGGLHGLGLAVGRWLGSDQIRRPKPEGRKKAELRNPNPQSTGSAWRRFGLRPSGFGLLSGFGLRISGFGRHIRVLLKHGLSVWVKRILLFHFVCLGWVFFRAASFHDALQMLGGIIHPEWSPLYGTAAKFLVLFSAPLLLLDFRLEKYQEEYPFQTCRGWVTRASYTAKAAFSALLLGIVMITAATGANAFIYFQF